MMRPLAISPLRLAGWDTIAQATRNMAAHRTDALGLAGPLLKKARSMPASG
ncbi:hypothetical protein ABIA33_000483 [Streptacidiphilus sp. MAP12-16]|uniref:hypothetical protein n=1 Tax=Streptacidiphilus sp. MAP12-16 TaxID=3156300 RepID=UPI003517DA33